VYRIAPDGSLIAERRGDTDGNAAVLSADETWLCVANWADNIVLGFLTCQPTDRAEVATVVSTGDWPTASPSTPPATCSSPPRSESRSSHRTGAGGRHRHAEHASS
jgi:hypothetical protein